MTSHTVYRTFNTDQRREFVRITEDVEEAVRESGQRLETLHHEIERLTP